MRKFLLVLLACAALALPAAARTVSVPPNQPAITVNLPAGWKSQEIEYGYSAMSPGDDVFVSVEYAKGKDVGGMMKLNESWMKENSIKPVQPTQEEGNINGVPVTHFEFDTTDENGKTLVDFFLMRAGTHVAMITVWGSVAERNKHQADIMGFMNSIKPVE